MRIVHIFRAPIGGLFRHVIDLAQEQAKRGHDVGVFCDSTFAGQRNEALLAELATHLTLGVERYPMHRNPHFSDLGALRSMSAFCSKVGADIMHGHGSKGGLYARLGGVVGSNGPVRAYTPHGGSLNYKPGALIHKLYMGIERVLEKGTDLFLFESRFVADRFAEFVGKTNALTRIVLNGLYREEIQPVIAKPDALDFLYIGEFRFAKGIDNLLLAMGKLKHLRPLPPTLVLVGQGPDEPALREQVDTLGLAPFISFHKPMAAREAFSLARTMIVPSRFESMPYVVIEAAGASIPLISTNVGGIPEIFGDERKRLIAADDIDALVASMQVALDSDHEQRMEPAIRLASHIEENFCVLKMTTTVLDAYAAAAICKGNPASTFATPAAKNAPHET
jgi:glycosyltransferase involved in cell wall biosynthesis